MFQVTVILSVTATSNTAITFAFFMVFNYSIHERFGEVKKGAERCIFQVGLNLKMRFFFQ